MSEKTRAKPVPKLKEPSFLRDVYTGRWLVSPMSAAKVAILVILAHIIWEYVVPVNWNPIRPFLYLSYKLPASEVVLKEASYKLYGPTPSYSEDDVIARNIRHFFQGVHKTLFPNEPRFLRYGKGWLDLCFVAYFVVVFSFLRQTLTMHVFKPLARRWGIQSDQKQTRFAEQGYALTYWGLASILGLYVMSFQDSWWFSTYPTPNKQNLIISGIVRMINLPIEYPHWVMRPETKLYYLLQASYWMQQAFVMLLGLERPRKDYYELIAHHLVTLWLIGWSYFINLTMIGTTVFVCMDIPDTWLALSKMLNYLNMDTATAIVYSAFMVVWTYFRIYLSARTLYSVYNDYHKIPAYARTFYPSRGHWLVWWMQCHVFAPLLLLLLLNIFWYYLMWRIFFRTMRGVYADEREEDEQDEQPPIQDSKKD
ncbi:sphingosine N-acyltransferase [Malassezia psittaci]|uniref:Sphingosine N-acyltransferase n=1 Tax=Malassezia psittaci TaxID=1821823 RepID=A0AAF0JEC6_9BASI|nr:sphingosine N-acyltransferase [Malassezia psittaci]